MLALTGVVSAMRYEILQTPSGPNPEAHSRGYVAVYDLEGDDLVGIREGVAAASAAGQPRKSDAINTDDLPPIAYLMRTIAAAP